MPKLESKKPVSIEQRVFAKNFKFVRQAANLSQQDIHLMTRLGQGYLSDVERLVASIGIDSMAAMSHAVQVPLYCLLQPDFPNAYNMDDPSTWQDYQRAIESTPPEVPYERLLLSRNFQIARKALGLKKKEVTELADLGKDFLTCFERGEVGITLTNAVKLAQVVGQPLHALLKP